MEGTPRLSETLVAVLSQHQNWVDLRPLKPLAWMIVGLIQARRRRLTAWGPYVPSRAVCAQSPVRRLTRWLENERIAVHALYGPLLQRALAEWGHQLGYLALDPSTRWHTYGVVRLSLVYRGRAMPLVWNVLDHPSRRVGYAGYQELLEKGAELLPCGCPVVFPADRGLADTPRMDPLVQLGWPWRIRIKGSFWVDRLGKRACNVKRMP
jgi:hypothetical protein